jgi:hypothetical protein
MARPPDGEIRGRVRSPEGLAVVDAVVEATGVGVTTDRTVTASDGSYRLRVPPGTYSVSARKGSAVPPPASPRLVPRQWDYYPPASLAPQIRVAAGRVVRAPDLELVHTRAVRVTVTVRDESGAVVPSASVSYVARRRATSVAGHFATEADGTLAVGPFSPGEVSMHARAREGTPAALAGVLRVSVGEEPLDDVTMVLSAGASLREASSSKAGPTRCTTHRASVCWTAPPSASAGDRRSHAAS